jgi:glycosyltransferase involved in cell wall biosynthesis
LPPAELHVAQFIPNLIGRDAVGNHTLMTARVLADAGIPNRIYIAAGERLPEVETRDFRSFVPADRTVLLYQASTGASEMVSMLIERREPLALSYHNITPSHFFTPYDPTAAKQLDLAAAELRLLAGRVEVAMAASEFNAAELRGLGVKDVRVIPPFSSHLAGEAGLPRRTTTAERGDSELLFVGRVVPSKGIERLLSVMALLRVEAPHVWLSIVGGRGPWTYMRELDRICRKLRLDNVRFLGSLDDADLGDRYRRATAFITLSRHEGFCLPVVEAMARELPVIALDAGATGETLGGAGVLLHSDDPLMVAGVVLEVLRNPALRESLARLGVERARAIESFPRADAIVDAVRVASAT